MDDEALEHWLDSVRRQFDNRAVDVIYEAHNFADAMSRSERRDVLMHLDCETTAGGGVRLSASGVDAPLELAGPQECAEFAAKLRATHCRDRFATLTDWFLFCIGRGPANLPAGDG